MMFTRMTERNGKNKRKEKEMRTRATLKKKRKFNGKWYDLDYTAERVYWKDFDRRLEQVKKSGRQYRVVTKSYPQFGTFKALYVRG